MWRCRRCMGWTFSRHEVEDFVTHLEWEAVLRGKGECNRPLVATAPRMLAFTHEPPEALPRNDHPELPRGATSASAGLARFMVERTGRSFASRWIRTAGTVSAPARVAETFWISSRARRGVPSAKRRSRCASGFSCRRRKDRRGLPRTPKPPTSDASPKATGGPSARTRHSTVWTGSEFIR